MFKLSDRLICTLFCNCNLVQLGEETRTSIRGSSNQLSDAFNCNSIQNLNCISVESRIVRKFLKM